MISFDEGDVDDHPKIRRDVTKFVKFVEDDVVEVEEIDRTNSPNKEELMPPGRNNIENIKDINESPIMGEEDSYVFSETSK